MAFTAPPRIFADDLSFSMGGKTSPLSIFGKSIIENQVVELLPQRYGHSPISAEQLPPRAAEQICIEAGP
jgi:hypothetical protein